MKIAPLALLTVFAASSSAFGLNGGAKSIVKTATRQVSFHKTALVQPVDVQGNRLSTVVSSVSIASSCEVPADVGEPSLPCGGICN